MHDPINFTDKDSMYEAAAAILRGETPTETLAEEYKTKAATVKKIMSLIEDLDAVEYEDLLKSMSQHVLELADEYDNEDQYELVTILNKAVKCWVNRSGN